MGLLIIPYDFIKYNLSVIESAFYWMKQECNADIKDVTDNLTDYKNQKAYSIEGEGIPKGNIRFDLICKELVKDVLIFSIE